MATTVHTVHTVRARLVTLRLEVDTWPQRHAVTELAAELDEWIHQLDTEPLEGFAERFERVGRIHERIRNVVAVLEEFDT